MARQAVSSSGNSEMLLESGTNEVEFLEFYVGEQSFGVNVAKVTQALVWNEDDLVRIPGNDHMVLGMVMFRDSPVLVVELAAVLGLTRSNSPENRSLLLVLEFNGKTTGFVTDHIAGIRRFSWEAFQRIEELGASVQGDASVVGSVNIEDRIVMILDVEAIMARIDPSMSMDDVEEVEVEEFQDRRKSIRIVFAEDSQVIQKTLVDALNRAGFEQIRVFSTGAEAFEYVKANPDEVDIIISDIEMPVMDGLAFCRELRAITRFRRTPFLFFSSMVTEALKRKCDRVGGDGAVAKPELAQVLRSIDELTFLRQDENE